MQNILLKTQPKIQKEWKKTFGELIYQLVVVNNPTYDSYERNYQARTLQSKAFYIFTYLLPGIIALLLINVKPVHDFLSNLFGAEGKLTKN